MIQAETLEMKVKRLEKALHHILEEEATACDGYETTVITIAREALGISAEEFWELD